MNGKIDAIEAAASTGGHLQCSVVKFYFGRESKRQVRFNWLEVVASQAIKNFYQVFMGPNNNNPVRSRGTGWTQIHYYKVPDRKSGRNFIYWCNPHEVWVHNVKFVKVFFKVWTVQSLKLTHCHPNSTICPSLPFLIQLFLLSNFSQQNWSVIQTRIVGVDGKQADHLTTTTDLNYHNLMLKIIFIPRIGSREPVAHSKSSYGQFEVNLCTTSCYNRSEIFLPSIIDINAEKSSRSLWRIQFMT